MITNLFKQISGKRWQAVAIAVLSFSAGSLVTALIGAHLMRLEPVRADNNRVYELNIYHAVPGKGADLEAVWRDASKVVAAHGMKILGYWVPNEDPGWKDRFIYVVEFSSREEADKQWKALHTDPAFRPYIEAAKPFIEKVEGHFHVDEIYMRPTEFSDVR